MISATYTYKKTAKEIVLVAILVIATVTIVIMNKTVAILAIVIGNMRMFKKLKDFIKAKPFLFVLGGWCLAFVIPLLFKPGDINRNEKDTLNFYEISFLSASALFTGIAFAVTYLSLKDQKENLNKQIGLLEKQIKMDVFSDVSEELRSEAFQSCRKYIYSTTFYDDMERIKELTKKDEISLQDFKDTCDNNNDGIDEDERQHFRDSYGMIIRYCGNMEYLGFIYYNSSTDIIVDYYGRTILNLYKRLKPLIETKDGEKTKYLYYYFAYLYNFAIRREKGYYEERDKVIKDFFIK